MPFTPPSFSHPIQSTKEMEVSETLQVILLASRHRYIIQKFLIIRSTFLYASAFPFSYGFLCVVIPIQTNMLLVKVGSVLIRSS